MKKKTHEILEKIRLTILSEDFKMAHRAGERVFIRFCLVTFPIMILIILNLMRKSLQVELNEFGCFMSLPIISKQTFSASRKKISPTAFIELNKILVKEFYSDNNFKTFLGYRVIAVDGTTLQLPEGESLKEKYGACFNQKEGMNMARVSHAYDPLNQITLHAIMAPYITSERDLVYDHVLETPCAGIVNDLYIFDRGYPSIRLLLFLILHQKEFIMRVSSGWLAIVNQILKSGKRDVIIEINAGMLIGEKRKDFINQFPNACLKSNVKIRVLIIDLCTGEKEVLITSLTESNAFKYEIFKDLYRLRWGSEENYKFHKVRLEVENFSGKTPHAVEQDFYATIVTGNIRALLSEEAEAEEAQIYRGKRKYDYKINKNVSIGILKNEIVEALFNPDVDLEVFCERMKGAMSRSVVPIRPERIFARIRKTHRKYPMNMRRAL